MDSRLVAQSAAYPAGHPHAAILAAAAVSEVCVPAARRRCRGADPGDPGSLDDAARRAEPETPGSDAEYQLKADLKVGTTTVVVPAFGRVTVCPHPSVFCAFSL